MPAITLAQAIVITDVLATQFIALRDTLGDTSVEEPSADTGVRGAIGALFDTVKGYSGNDFAPLLSALVASGDRASVQQMGPAIFDLIQDGLDALAKASGLPDVTSLSGFFTSYNVGAGATILGALNTGLVAPAYGLGVYKITTGSNLAARNIYSPTIANMAQKVGQDGALTPGTKVNEAIHAGAARALLTYTGLVGSGTVVVTGRARTTAGTVSPGRVFTAEINNGTATLLVPVVPGDLLVEPLAIDPDSGISAGTGIISCAPPSGRTELDTPALA